MAPDAAQAHSKNLVGDLSHSIAPSRKSLNRPELFHGSCLAGWQLAAADCSGQPEGQLAQAARMVRSVRFAVTQFACCEDKEANVVSQPTAPCRQPCTSAPLVCCCWLADLDLPRPLESCPAPVVACRRLQAKAERLVRCAAAAGAQVILLQVRGNGAAEGPCHNGVDWHLESLWCCTWHYCTVTGFAYCAIVGRASLPWFLSQATKFPTRNTAAMTTGAAAQPLLLGAPGITL